MTETPRCDVSELITGTITITIVGTETKRVIDPGESPQCDNTSRPYRLNGSEDDNGSGGGLYILTHKFFLFTPQLLALYFSAFCASAVVDYYDSGEDH
jgi:hypothetical protein